MQNAKAKEADTLKSVELKIEARARAGCFADKIRTDLQARGLVADVLKSVPNLIPIDGYTDSVPIATAQFPSNLFLSSARSARVAEYFMGLGLIESRLFPEGLGERDPVATNDTAAGRAQNRRVEIIVQSEVVKETSTTPASTPRRSRRRSR